MPLSYEAVHWGTPSSWIEHGVVFAGRARAWAPIVAISYATLKADKPAIWRHEFSRQGGRLPYLLVPGAHARFDVEAPRPGTKLIAIGRIVDLELANGEVLVPVAMWAATDHDGGAVYIVARENPNMAIEARAGGPFVTEDGIVN